METVRTVSVRRKSLISKFVRYAEVPGSIPGFPILLKEGIQILFQSYRMGLDEYRERVKEISRKQTWEVRGSKRGVTEVVAVTLLTAITVGSASIIYTYQDSLIDEASDQDFEVSGDTRIVVESCWANESGTYLSVRNSNRLNALNTGALSVFVNGEPQSFESNKDRVRPQETFILETDDYFDGSVDVRVQNQGYFFEASCGVVVPMPDAEIDYEPRPVIEGRPTKFEDESEGLIESRSWKGAITGSSEEITYTFNSPGTETIGLEVTDVRGYSDTETRQIQVLEDSFFDLTLEDFADPVRTGDNFQLEYSVENTRIAFDTQEITLEIDGEVKDSETHTLAGAASEMNTLEWQTTESDKGIHEFELSGDDDFILGDFEVKDMPVLDADFTYGPNNPETGQSVYFTDQSTVPGLDDAERNWDFGNGDTSEEENPQTTYQTSGTYQVSLTIINDGVSDTETKTITVEEDGGATEGPDPSPDPTPDPETEGQLLETGGSTDGEIGVISTPNDPAISRDMIFKPLSGSICIGTNCASNEASIGSGYDTDNYVNETGDGMSGSLHPGVLRVQSGGNMCIGVGCGGDLSNPSGQALSGENQETETGFVLELDTIVPLEGNLDIE